MHPAKVLLCLLALSAARCATVAHGRYQSIPVTSSPAGASVQVDCGNGLTEAGITPTTVRLRRKAPSCRLLVSAAGFAPASVTLQRTRSRSVWLNAIPGAAVGALFGAGAAEGSMLNESNDSAANNAFVAGCLIGGGAGMLVDRATGAWWKFVPERVEVTLMARP